MVRFDSKSFKWLTPSMDWHGAKNIRCVFCIQYIINMMQSNRRVQQNHIKKRLLKMPLKLFAQVCFEAIIFPFSFFSLFFCRFWDFSQTVRSCLWLKVNHLSDNHFTENSTHCFERVQIRWHLQTESHNFIYN